VLQPLIYQTNGKFTQHLGIGGSVVYHLHENFALMVMGSVELTSPRNRASTTKLINKVRAEAQAATSVLLNGGVVGGVEVTPFYGKSFSSRTTSHHFSLVINGGAGAGSTSLQLKPTANLRQHLKHVLPRRLLRRRPVGDSSLRSAAASACRSASGSRFA